MALLLFELALLGTPIRLLREVSIHPSHECLVQSMEGCPVSKSFPPSLRYLSGMPSGGAFGGPTN
jgi:hypothetical protein